MMTGLTEKQRRRAAPFMPKTLRPAMKNLLIEPVWFEDGKSFWYRRDGAEGSEYVVVDAETAVRRPAFDHGVLRPLLEAEGVDFNNLEILSSARDDIVIASEGKVWRFEAGGLTPLPPRPNGVDESLSPDGQRVVFRRDGDLWLREVATGIERRLTQNAAPHFEWAKSPDQSLETLQLEKRGITLPPILIWSPDSKKIFTYQLDERAVRIVPLQETVPEDGGLVPKVHLLRNAFTGDADLPMAHQAVIDVETGAILPVDGGPTHVAETSLIERSEAWWSQDSKRVFFLDHDRYEQWIDLVEVDAASGMRRKILTETDPHFVDVNMAFGAMPNIALLDETDEIVWFSQRDGWAHLYLFDLATGAAKRQLTSGEFVVRDLLGIDKTRRRLFFVAGGRGDGKTPYRRTICSVDLDSGKMSDLTPEPGDHSAALRSVGWSDTVERASRLAPQAAALAPDGRHFVEIDEDFDRLARTVLRRADGTIVAELERAECRPDLPGEAPKPLCFPESLAGLAADGETDIYGMLWLPADFDPQKRYPVIDMIYPGPQCTQVPLAGYPADAGEFRLAAKARAFAEAGFAVVAIDGRGTPYRSKAFHDLCHQNLDNPGFLTDHVAFLKTLFAARPYLDADRVAIMGHSAGGHAAARAIFDYPDVFHAAIATAGSHEPRCYNHCWPEKWQGKLVVNADGTSNYDAVANAPRAHRLRGALLLGHGGIDENVHPAITDRVAQALVDAGLPFETLFVPQDDHYTYSRNPKVLWRELDFLCRHLK